MKILLPEQVYYYLNAMVADWAMWATWGPVKMARDAPLHSHRDAVYLYVFV